jgi:hypothetical protein
MKYAKQNNKKPNVLSSPMPFIIGIFATFILLFASFGNAHLKNRQDRVLKNGIGIDGTVKRIAEVPTITNRTAQPDYKLDYQYTTLDQHTYNGSAFMQNVSAYSVGSRIGIVYNPNQPEISTPIANMPKGNDIYGLLFLSILSGALSIVLYASYRKHRIVTPKK